MWTKESKRLDPERLQAIQIALTVKTLQILNADAITVVVSPRTELRFEDQDLVSQRVAAMFDLEHALRQTGEVKKKELEKFRRDWGQEASLIENRLIALQPKIDQARDQIFSEAEKWETGDVSGVKLKTSKSLLSYLPEQKIHIEEQTGFMPYGRANLLARYVATGVANVASVGALDLSAHAAGAYTAAVNPLAHTDIKVAAGMFAVTEAVWIGSAVLNGMKQFDLDAIHGVSTSGTAKVFREFAERRTDERRMHKAAFVAGSIAWQLLGELPYFAAAVLFPLGYQGLNPEYNPDNAAFSYLTGANVAGIAYNSAQALTAHCIVKASESERMRRIGVNAGASITKARILIETIRRSSLNKAD